MAYLGYVKAFDVHAYTYMYVCVYLFMYVCMYVSVCKETEVV